MNDSETNKINFIDKGPASLAYMQPPRLYNNQKEEHLVQEEESCVWGRGLCFLSTFCTNPYPGPRTDQPPANGKS